MSFQALNYSQGGGTNKPSPYPHIDKSRAPNTTDVLYQVGQLWVDQPAETVYCLTSFSASAGITSANWALLGAEAGNLNTLTGDSGGAISPSTGNITLAGTSGQITTTGSGSTITWTLSSSLVAPGSLEVTGLLKGDAGATLNTAGTAMNIATDNDGSAVNIGNGTSGRTIHIGTSAAANLITIGSASGASSISMLVGSGNFSLAGGGNTVGIANDAAANVVVLGSTTASASLTLQSGSGGNTLIAGNAAATITVGATAQSGAIAIGNSSGALAVSLLSGTPSANTQTLNLVNGATTGGTQVVNIFATTSASTAQTLNIFSGINTNTTNIINVGSSTGTLVTCNLLTGAVAHVLNIGSASSGNMAITCGGTATVLGTLNINATGSKITTIGTGGTGAVNIGNATGNTSVTGSLTATTTLTATLGAITATAGDFVATNGGLQLQTVGNKISIKAGTTGFCGTGTLSSGTVTINNTNIATGDIILLTRTAANGSTTFGILTYTISNGASFTVTSLILGTPGSTQTADTSTFAYVIIRPL